MGGFAAAGRKTVTRFGLFGSAARDKCSKRRKLLAGEENRECRGCLDGEGNWPSVGRLCSIGIRACRKQAYPRLPSTNRRLRPSSARATGNP